MTFNKAKKLHNGDEVIDKVTKESIKVLSIELIMDCSYGDPAVIITGIGSKQGFSTWHHFRVW